jgi:hypothetical protein
MMAVKGRITQSKVDPALAENLVKLIEIANEMGAEGVWLIRDAGAVNVSATLPNHETATHLDLAGAGAIVVLRFPAGDGPDPLWPRMRPEAISVYRLQRLPHSPQLRLIHGYVGLPIGRALATADEEAVLTEGQQTLEAGADQVFPWRDVVFQNQTVHSPLRNKKTRLSRK